MTATALRMQGVSKDFGDTPALLPLDLEVPSGERITLLGHNGSGKTTMLRMIAGALEPTTGEIVVAGHPVGSVGARAFTSMLGDQPVFYDDLSLAEHLEYIARLHGTDDWQGYGDELLERFGLGERRGQLPMTFSRGLKQKAAIVLAFIRPFEVMVVDEPFVGLDQPGRIALLELFERAHADGATLIVATHELATVTAADRIVALRDGAVIYDGPPAGADVDELVRR